MDHILCSVLILPLQSYHGPAGRSGAFIPTLQTRKREGSKLLRPEHMAYKRYSLRTKYDHLAPTPKVHSSHLLPSLELFPSYHLAMNCWPMCQTRWAGTLVQWVLNFNSHTFSDSGELGWVLRSCISKPQGFSSDAGPWTNFSSKALWIKRLITGGASHIS